MNKEEGIVKYRERLKPFIDEVIAKSERRQKAYENYLKKVKEVKSANNV